MPTGFVAQVAKSKGVSTAEAEKKWNEAKKTVSKEKYGTGDKYWAVVTRVLKNMMGIKENEILSLENWLVIQERKEEKDEEDSEDTDGEDDELKETSCTTTTQNVASKDIPLVKKPLRRKKKES